MSEVAKGIRRVKGFSNSYLVEQPDGKLTLVDCGMQAGGEKILAELTSMGRKPDDVTTIVLTHAHSDHVGGAKKLKAATGAKLAAHEAEAAYVTRDSKFPRAKGAMGILSVIMGVFVRVAPAEVDVRLKEGDKVGRLGVVNSPGHTPGSIVLVDDETKSVFTGDAVVSGKGGLMGPNKAFTMDMAEALRSVAKISGLRFETVLPGHGDPVKSPDAPQQVAKLAT
jgi:glyoxylase-like metal-dependent hydrolase (beta-lactamase superfamily II)